MPNQEKIFCLLTSLGPQYETFTTTMLKLPRPTYPEVILQLKKLDQRRNWFSNKKITKTPSIQLVAAFKHNNHGVSQGYAENPN